MTNSDVSGSSLPGQVTQLSIYALCIEGRNLRLFIDAQTIGLEVSVFVNVGREWLGELKTLQQSAHRPAHDGGPVVAIDGLDRLAAYLRAGSGGSGGTCGELANVLDELARHAEKRPDDPKAAESWLRVMENCLTRATELSQKALGAELPR